jgi:hypothetical protein
MDRLDTNPYMGFHRRVDEDYYGCLYFEVFKRGGEFYWVSSDMDSTEHGFYEGPFNSPKEAYHEAVGRGEEQCRD